MDSLHSLAGDKGIGTPLDYSKFSKTLPNFFTTIVVTLPIKSGISRISKQNIILIAKSYLIESFISSLITIGTGVFKGCQYFCPLQDNILFYRSLLTNLSGGFVRGSQCHI